MCEHLAHTHHPSFFP
uniref:Uncharacterized protein n=1 Tax=Rhizophora mucronata TaxID=61149 RepID=A0A2P2PCZ2_RHIMU